MNSQVWEWFGLVQMIFMVMLIVFLFGAIRQQRGNRQRLEIDSSQSQAELERLREIHLTEPLTAITRPETFADVIGQEEGIRALRAAMCGPNPQHVLLYGPPGVGKTTVARLILEEAKSMPQSPFAQDAVFVEVDGATSRFDERGIADPLIGSVHDPIYQGAGAYGTAGIPQPKAGAVTKAHGGILYIDEIGELHPMQMNKLLKVLEDRRVLLESAYYSAANQRIPAHIHDIFANGLPADFRLIAATTRKPAEIPAAIRSRCLEIYFRDLTAGEVEQVAQRAAERIGCQLEDAARTLVGIYAHNGREAVNLVQIAAGMAAVEQRTVLEEVDIQWVVDSCRYTPRVSFYAAAHSGVGIVNILAVCDGGTGMVGQVEAVVVPSGAGPGEITVTGIVEEEELSAGPGQRLHRRSMASCAVENVCTALRHTMGIHTERYHIHVNFPGGMAIDGPSGGIAVACAIYSALRQRPVDGTLAMTGEVSIRGRVLPVGGIRAKVEAARAAGLHGVILPRDCWQAAFSQLQDLVVTAVDSLEQVLELAVLPSCQKEQDRTGCSET